MKFWEVVLSICKNFDIFLVIDEGLGFSPTLYPHSINTEKVVRIVSLSKKYGIPGMKLGFLLAGQQFMSDFYESASSNYGGPLSFFFLLSEFLHSFEFISIKEDFRSSVLSDLSKRYLISMDNMDTLYKDYIETVSKNKKTFETNHSLLLEWYSKNKSLFKACYDFQGFNIFFEPKTSINCHDLFLRLLRDYKVSVLPSDCLGDSSDTLIRITLLEPTNVLIDALGRLEIGIQKYESKI